MFINLTNHPSSAWSDEQKEDAKRYGDIIDIPFKHIEANFTADDIEKKVDEMFNEVISIIEEKQPGFNNTIVMCQGEYVTTYKLVNKLKKKNITVVSAVSNRETVEVQEDGATKKISVFKYAGLREY